MINLSCGDIVLGTARTSGAWERDVRSERRRSARTALKVLRGWLAERAAQKAIRLRQQSQIERLSRDAVEQIVRRHVNVASAKCPSLKKKRVTPHVLRHSAAMQLLQNGVDRTVIALWLGHELVETTQMYIHADIQLKERAMARTRPVRRRLGATAPTTSCSPSSRRSDYADMPRRCAPVHGNHSARHNPEPGIMSVMPISA